MLDKNLRASGYIIKALLALAICIQLFGCTDKVSTNELIVGIEAEPERFDPLTMKNPKNFIVSWQIYEGLFTLDKTGKIAPVIADKWETTDSLTWRIHVRDGVTFHKSEIFGSPAQAREVTAEDVAASYTAFCSSKAYASFILTDSILGCADYNAGKSDSVEGIRVIDNETVEFQIVKPEPFFLNRLTTAWIAIFPKELMDPKYETTRGLDVAVGTGPYRMLSRTSSEIILERNPGYWDEATRGDVSRLVYRVISNDEIRLAELNKGGIDLMVVPPILYPALLNKDGTIKKKYSERFRLHHYKTLNSHMIGYNDNLIPDVHLRRAMNFATDRKTMVNTLFYGQADITGGTVPPGLNGYVPPFNVDELFNLEIARKELALSSYAGEPLDMLVHEQAGSEQIGQLFQSQMQKIGVNIQLTKVDFNTAIGRMIQGDAPIFSMFLDYVFSTPEAVLFNIFSSDKRPIPNFWQFSDPGIDSEMEALRSMSQEERIKKSAYIEKQIMEQAPANFLYRLNQMVIYSRRFEDIAVNEHGHFEFDQLQITVE